MGELLFGDEINRSVSHEPNDVMYIAFTGAEAAPGADGVGWAVGTKEEFVESIRGLCDELIRRHDAS